MRCPRCNIDLLPVVVEDAGVRSAASACSTCEGKFFAAGDLAPLAEIVKIRLIEFRSIPSERTQMSPLCCPACAIDDEPMLKVQHERDAAVTVDVCARCRGTWLDKGELDAIQEEGALSFLVHMAKWMRGG